ncbi:MAG: hypothetical protein HFI33_15405 [Lachnospiraceae bacterium]|nr:hypothetical protein [Lachnospiraceae bacterium]
MANRNFNGVQINQSVTIVEKAGTQIQDCRNRVMVYDEDGNVVLAADGTKPFAGIALIEAGMNDISGVNAGRVEAGEPLDIQIKDMGYVLAGGDIAKGAEIAAGADGVAVTAAAGDYVLGIALDAVEKDDYCYIQISKYQKN